MIRLWIRNHLFKFSLLVVMGWLSACAASQPCQIDAECSDGAHCDPSLQRCVQACQQNSDCTTAQMCHIQRGRCIATTPPNPPTPCQGTPSLLCQDGNAHGIDACGNNYQKENCGERGCNAGKCNEATPISSGCGDGICQTDANEDCFSCPLDCACPTGQRCDPQQKACETAPACGDGVCDPLVDEDCATCPIDCQCPAQQRCDPTQRLCILFLSCGNGLCEANEGEDCASCPIDCTCPSQQRCINQACQIINPCGDGVCSTTDNENCDTCPVDCKCPSGQVCRGGGCQEPPAQPVCGDGRCESGESQSNCCRDCGCPSGQSCELPKSKDLGFLHQSPNMPEHEECF